MQVYVKFRVKYKRKWWAVVREERTELLSADPRAILHGLRPHFSSTFVADFFGGEEPYCAIAK